MRLVASSGSGGEGARPSGAAVAARQQAMSVAVSRVMGEREEGEEGGGGSREWLEEEERSLAPLIRLIRGGEHQRAERHQREGKQSQRAPEL